MAIEEHIHALPRRLADIRMIYPEGVLVFDVNEKRIYIGDGHTAGGLPLPDTAELLSILRQFKEFEAAMKDLEARMVAIARQQAIIFG